MEGLLDLKINQMLRLGLPRCPSKIFPLASGLHPEEIVDLICICNYDEESYTRVLNFCIRCLMRDVSEGQMVGGWLGSVCLHTQGLD